MPTITIGNRSFEAPVLVPSVSSFETQLPPAAALRLQTTLGEPISLLSAFDVWREPDLIDVAKDFRKQGILLLDSGGYESSRISYHARDTQQCRWNYEKYTKIAREDIYDFIFSFDYFLRKKEPANEFSQRIIGEFQKHAAILDAAKLIPVVHIQTADGSRTLSDCEVIDLFREIASKLKYRFVAVPERELGDGISARVRLTRSITNALQESSPGNCSLHILGCGNLLSFSLLAVAGAVMCDGLEWCRTLTAENFHLHHFQQKDVFSDPRFHIGNPMAEFMVDHADLNYKTSVGLRNLLGFQIFTRELHRHLQTRNVHEFISQNFGQPAGDAMRALET
jgi:hypothetical protein